MEELEGLISTTIVAMLLFIDLVVIMRAIKKEDNNSLGIGTFLGVIMIGYVTFTIIALCANPH